MDPTERISRKSPPTYVEGMSSKSLLMTLPNELFLEVASNLQSFEDLNSLVRTSSFFHAMFNPHLFRRAVDADGAVLDDIVGWVLSSYRLASLTLLLDHGLSVNRTYQFTDSAYEYYEETMLRFLCRLNPHRTYYQARSVPLARLLIQRGADLELKDAIRSETVLYIVIQHHNFAIAAQLLKHGAESNAVNKWGETPLWLASMGENLNGVRMVNLLIAHGVAIDGRLGREAPLFPAIRGWNYDVIQVLLAHGADAGIHNQRGETPLHMASRWFRGQDYREHKVVKSLLEHGAVVNATDLYGESPLHWACGVPRDRGLFMVKFLLENGADINAISGLGFNPLQVASSRNNQSGAALLFTHGADVGVLNRGEGEQMNEH
jgi:ankyrin repeat protein